MSNFLLILVEIIMFGALIAVHEFGHFITAKLSGVKVNEFAIGMGPKLWSRQGAETLYSLRLFPIGGYCAMEGEDEDTGDPRSFLSASAWKKFIILVAGATMNFLVGFLIFLLLSMNILRFNTTTVADFVDGFSAQGEQGLMVGDRILEIDGHAIYLYQDITIFFERGGQELDLTVERDGRRVELGPLHMPWLYSYDEAGNQLFYSDGSPVLIRGIRTLPKTPTLADRFQFSWYQSIDTVRLVWLALGDLLTGSVGIRDMSGPVGIMSMMGQMAQESPSTFAAFENILRFIAFIAVNLAVMNLLPIPALDGGRILFLVINLIYTAFTKKRLDPKYEGAVNTVFFVALLGLMAVVMVSDILKLFGR